MSHVTGRISFKFNGNTVRSLPGAKIMFGSIERTPFVDDQGGVHYTEKPMMGGAEFTIPHSAGLSVADIAGLVGVTMEAETDTGKLYQGRNAFVTNSLELSANENGEFPVNVSCDPMVEVS